MLLGSHRVERSEHGWWVYPRNGARGRFYPHGSRIARQIDSGIAIDGMERTRRSFASGTHEPVKAWRNSDGTIGIPPDPSFAPPADSVPFEIRTLAEADRVSREMEADLRSRWEGDHEFVAINDAALGDPRKELIRRMGATNSAMERDVIRLALADLDRIESERQQITTHAAFRWRDYDH